MALPTSGLTAHYRADVTTNLFTTYQGSGVHTGTPADGNIVQVWDETAGVADQMYAYGAGDPNIGAVYRSSTPLMKNSCLDFTGTRQMKGFNQTAGANKNLASFITVSLHTVILAIWPQAITSTAANVYDGEAIIGDIGQYWGLFLRDVSGTKKISGYSFDGSVDEIAMTITTAHTWIVVYQHTGGNLQLSLIDEAGTETSAANVASGDIAGDLLNQMALGQTVSAFGNFRIGEFAIWNTALGGGTDLADAKQYFKDQWLTLVTRRRPALLGRQAVNRASTY